MTRMLPLVLLLVGAAPAAEALDVAPAPYQAALAAGLVGTVEGRAYEERRTPRAADRPLTGTTVVLVPRSQALLARMEQVRHHARDSIAAYRAAITEVRKAREAYEAELWHAGAPDLVMATLVDAGGAFRVSGVPEGAWILVATHALSVAAASPRAPQGERRMYRIGPRLVGYQAVTLWIRELDVGQGSHESVELSDRNAWMTGVVEERVQDGR